MNPLKRSTNLTSVDTVQEWVTKRASCFFAASNCEPVPIEKVAGRILQQPFTSPVNLPPLRRAMMDGIAICCKETLGSKDWVVVLESEIDSFAKNSSSHPAIEVHTGSPIIEPFDSVVPIELLIDSEGKPIAELPLGTRVQIKAAKPVDGANVAQIGEDVYAGQLLFSAGRTIRVQDIAMFAALNVQQVLCKSRPTVEILITGDEVAPQNNQAFVHDANGPVLEAFLQRDSGQLTKRIYLTDDRSQIEQAIGNSHADVILVSGGTSVGSRDYSADTVASLGKLHFHGIDMRPGKPMGVGEVGGKVVFLLPGNPVACQFGYELFVRPYLQIAGRGFDRWPYSQTTGKLTANIDSQKGRVDYLRVRIEGDLIIPLTSGRGSNLSTVTQADGFILIAAETEVLVAQEQVSVYLYDK